MIEIEIPTKIISKKNKMKVFKNRIYKSKEIKDFEKMVAGIALVEMNKLNLLPTSSPIKMSLDVWLGDNRKRDLQNFFDTICDALQSVVYIDDSQIVELSAKKWISTGSWKFKVKIEIV